MGDWVFTPARANDTNATLRDDYRRVDLKYSAPLLEVLLTELDHIEAYFVTVADNSKGSGSRLSAPLPQAFHA